MKFVIFGLTVSSSWGNGHATLWRGLCKALARRSHRVVFFERDVPYYRATRDLSELEGGALYFYERFDEIEERARRETSDSDVAIVTSYCPDGPAAARLVLERARGARVFYDLDTPVTLASVAAGKRPDYLPATGLAGFDLVLSFTGGAALDGLRRQLGAGRVAPLYGHVDPDVHRPARASERFRCSLSYLGTYSQDRERGLEELFVQPALASPRARFLLAGSQYPDGACWPANVVHHPHVAPATHACLFCSSRATLNVTRATMASFGHCPSGRLFEASACGAALVTDWFDGLDDFFDPDREVFVARTRDDVLGVLSLGDAELDERARAAQARTLAAHTSERRAEELEALLWASAPRAALAVGG